MSRLFIGLLLWASLGAAQDTRPFLDLSPFGELSTWDGATARVLPPGQPVPGGLGNVGVAWREERDVREVRVQFAGAATPGLKVEYWFRTWPYAPPAMPTIEDPADDPWQGAWLAAETKESCEGSECRYAFQPLGTGENRLASNLPGVTYRRTLKVRLAGEKPLPAIASLRVYSDSREKEMSVRIALGQGERAPAAWSGAVEVSNGKLKGARPWRFAAGDRFDNAGAWKFTQTGAPKGIIVDLVAADPELPGSLDSTLVTVRTGGTEPRAFSFNVDDLKDGPIYVPDFHAYVTRASDPAGFQAPAGRGPRIRSLIPKEPEQTYQRASSEIPPLDPWQRQNGGRVYLPVAPDASWQKFAVEYGGNVFISKRGTKAKGNELARLQWRGDRIQWKLGTGEKPYFRDDRGAKVSVLDDYLPVVLQEWNNDGLRYGEEAFATVLRGPLSPRDPARSEQTPAILMLRLTARNEGSESKTAHLWLVIDPAEEPVISGRQLRAAGGQFRALIDAPAMPGVEALPGAEGRRVAHLSFPVPAGGSQSVLVKLPFVSDLNEADARDLENLSYDSERARVVSYWKDLVAETVRFSVPEPKFNMLARAIVPHIHIGTTKDPKSGLYMVPAAGYDYQVFANETCFQALLLDVFGDHRTATEYLETLLALQGSRNYPGLHKGPYDAIFHGARVDSAYDYTASSYGLDHGTVLWALAEHYLYTRDRAWLEKSWPRMRKAIDWIVEQRAATRQPGAKEYGLLPAGHLEDNSDWANWFAVNAYGWAGMDRSARALEDIGHGDAALIRREADAYRKDLRDAVERAWENAPVARLRDGTYAPYVPVEPYQRFRRFGPKRVAYYTRYGKEGVNPTLRLSATREVLYGPIILLNLGLFEPDEPVARWILDDWEDNQTLTSGLGLNVHGLTDDKLWFSQGGMVFQANLQNPALVYLRRHEAPAAIRSIYNNFVACLYPDVNAFTEEYRMWRRASGPFYKTPDEARFVNRLRDALVLEEGDTLWLAGGVPRRWLESGEGIGVERIATYFGPVSLNMKAAGPGAIDIALRLPETRRPGHVRLVARVPKGQIRTVTVDGRPWTKFDAAREAIDLPPDARSVQVKYR